MTNEELTAVINSKIDEIRNQINKLNRGGCIGILTSRLDDINLEIQSLVSTINGIENNMEVSK
jgi:hypothetical protein